MRLLKKDGFSNVNYKQYFLYTKQTNLMKTKSLIIVILGLFFTVNCFSQKKSKAEVKEAITEPAPVAKVSDEPIITEECLVNLSLMNESAKNKQYADAIKPWYAVFDNCPNANRAIYSRGREILQWEIAQQTDPAEYKRVFDKLMEMYDSRIKYFGNDEKYSANWIIGVKGLDYFTYAKDDVQKKPAYQWLEQSIDGLVNDSELEILRVFMVISYDIYKADSTHAEKFINDFNKISKILDNISKSETPNASTAAELKTNIEYLFVTSGVAKCEKLDEIYSAAVDKNISDMEYLNSVISMYRRAGCTESEIYFKAAVAVHKDQPSVESARACGAMSYKKGEYNQSITFYREAIALSNDKEEQADLNYAVAQIYYKDMNNYPRSREFARNALGIDPKYGRAHVLIATMYAKSKIYDDPILAKTIYWVAVDQLIKAKQADPSLAEDVNGMIRNFTPHFPSKEDVFFHQQLQAGKSFTVEGWINETTICR